MRSPEVSEIRNMLRARANSDLLVVELCRTSSTSSPAEREREVWLIILENLHLGILRTFVVV